MQELAKLKSNPIYMGNLLTDYKPFIADIYVNMRGGRIRRAFSYLVPAEYDFIGPGWRVTVPFGKMSAEGFVVDVRKSSDSEDISTMKSIADVPDESPWFDPDMMKLATWMSAFYACSPGETLRLFIPGKTGIRPQLWYKLNESLNTNHGHLFEVGLETAAIYALIQERGQVSYETLRSRFGAVCRRPLEKMIRQGLLKTFTRVGERGGIKWSRVLKLAVPVAQATAALSTLKRKPAQQRLLMLLIEQGTLTEYDAAAKGLTKAGWAVEEKVRVMRNSYGLVRANKIGLQLNAAQHKALTRITQSIVSRQADKYLLMGVTGSGKTEVYLRATAATLAEGRQALVLIPEIAQTSQLLRRFHSWFGDSVAVVHSRLSLGERRDVWDRFRNGEISVVVGTRSALFTPTKDLGLIVVDEEHEFTYKQEEAPCYLVRDVAKRLADIKNATLVFGSATPALETFHAIQSGEIQLLELPNRIDGRTIPEVEVVDMRNELKRGRRSIISEPLEKLLMQTLDKKEQAILLLNRRGHSTFILCRECGYVSRCRHCSVPMVYHLHGGRLKCHYCDSTQAAPDICPSCGSRFIRYFGAGTQRLETELDTLFPGIRLARMDQDTTGGKMGPDFMLDQFRAGEYDILLGTQIVAKGHDIPNVTAVGIIAADSMINLPDFRSGERTFSLVMQAAGRCGRGEKKGRVVVQTYNPSHYAVIAGAAQDYKMFFEQEIVLRNALAYPPYSRLIKFTLTDTEEKKALQTAEFWASKLGTMAVELEIQAEIIGPYAAPLSKIGDRFRFHILIKGTRLEKLTETLSLTGISEERGVQVDVDPVTMM